MENKQKQTGKIVAGLLALVALIVVFIVCYTTFRPETQTGSKQFTVQVIDDKGEVTTYEGCTDAEYLRQALEEFGDLTVEGTESEYGLMIDTVNGLTADYSVNKSYWSILVNGEYGQYGVDGQPIINGDVFTLQYVIDSAE